MKTITCPHCGKRLDPGVIASAIGSRGASAGGRATAATRTPEQRREAARKALAARWAKHRARQK